MVMFFLLPGKLDFISVFDGVACGTVLRDTPIIDHAVLNPMVHAVTS